MGIGDVLSAKEFSRPFLIDLFEKARQAKEKPPKAEGKVGLLFFEPSTRTYNSFKVAAENLGLDVMGFSGTKGTSVKKGESLVDTARMFTGYGADCLVVRHPSAGAARYLSEHVEVPVVNAGDDSHEHPTQALLDTYTIWEEFGGLDGLRVGLMGDLRYGRTPSSLAYALANWDVELRFMAPEVLQVDKRNDSMEGYLQEQGVDYTKTDEVEIRDLDVLYVTRVQRERFPDEAEYRRVKGAYQLAAGDLQGARESMIVLHPLPRVGELDESVDHTRHARYFEQAANGLHVREALLKEVVG